MLIQFVDGLIQVAMTVASLMVRFIRSICPLLHG